MGPYDWNSILGDEFPNLYSEGFQTVAGPSGQYNCVGYAAEDTTRWWWPDGINYWPTTAVQSDSTESFREMFATLGYEVCEDSNVQAEYLKIALYEAQGEFQHVAIQMPNGRWRSKMGRGPLIEHSNPDSLSGGPYGNPVTYMRRPASVSAGPQ